MQIRAIDVALTQLGVSEKTGHNDGIPADRYMRGDRYAWCAGFVLWCFDQSDASLYKSVKGYYRLRSVQKFEDEMKRRGVWMGWNIVPQPNDIIFFANRGRSDAGRGRHVGLVEEVSAGMVHTIEGNTGDAVRERNYSLANKRISGYARP